MEQTRIRLKPEVALSDVDLLASQTSEWRLDDFSSYEEHKPYRQVWVSKDGKTTIEYSQDADQRNRHFTITGKNQAHHAAIIRKALATDDEESR